MVFDNDAEAILEGAIAEATGRRHEYVCAEHLLFSLITNENGRRVIEACGGSTHRLRAKLDHFLSTKMERVSSPFAREPQQTIGFQRILQRAILHAQYSSGTSISPGDLLAALFTETETHAVYFLQQEGLSRLDVLEQISHGEQADPDDATTSENDEDGEEESDRGASPLAKYTVDLVARAREGLIDPLVGRDREIERTIHILCRRNKNNPLFVGDQGVGKTAIAEGLAQRVVDGKVPEKLKSLSIYSLDLGALLAGTRFRGDFEQRLKAVLNALAKIPDSVLFIDEIHTIIGAGATSGGTLDAANLLKPVLTKGSVRFMGSTTFEEYKNHFEKDRALARRFLKIDVLEPSVQETVEILKGLRSRFEDHHGVRYSDAAIRGSAELSAKYINERFLPDKAIDVLDEAGAIVSLRQDSAAAEPGPDEEQGQGERARPIVKLLHVEKVVASIARIPPRTVSTSDKEKLRSLDGQLKQVVFGQDEAIDALTLSIRRSRAGLGSETKPIGSFLFAGPTGVGKTEVARQLAKVLGLELVRFDMSEYMEKHTVARLIGAPPGYVGFEQGGLLTDAIIKTPHAVLLLDEIEKAHPDLFNILLQVMDHATLTDNNGRKADFRNVIIIMTSNVGSEGMASTPIGFGTEAGGVAQGAIDKLFRPEFRNRLDAIIKFRPLPREVLEQVVDKFIVEIDQQLIRHKATITITPEARAFVIDNGYKAVYGARSIYRYIQTQVKDALADELLFGKLSHGGSATIVVKDGALHVELVSSGEAPPPDEGGTGKRSRRRKEKATASR